MLTVAIAGTETGAENFINAFHALGAEAGAVLEERTFDRYDGLVLPGGADIDPALFGEENHGSTIIERDRDLRQLEILDIFIKAEKPVLGICKGHQLLNVFFGGKLCQHIPEHEVHQCIGKDQAHSSRCLSDCFLAKIYGTTEFSVNSAHHQAIIVPVKGFIPVQWAPDGVLEAMIHESLPITGIQWHPERMCLKHRREDTVDGLPVFQWFLEQIASDQSKKIDITAK